MLFESLLKHAADQPDEPAVIDDHGRYSYRQLAGMAALMARVMGQRTAAPRVGILLPSGAGFVAAFYGALLTGKAVVPINFLLGEKEIAHCIADSGIDAVVTAPQLAGLVKAGGLEVIDVAQVMAAASQSPAEKAAGEPPLKFPSPGADDLAVLMYTSGTSGLPKGVLLSYGNLQADVDGAIAHANFQQRHRFLGIVPLFHAFGMTAMMLAPIQLGATVIYMARFSPVGTVTAIREHQVSLLLGVPSMFAAMLRLKNASADDFKSIYAVISGGEPLPAALRDGFQNRFGVGILEAYGMTETSLAIALNTPQSQRAGSVGRAIPGMEIKIADEAGNAQARGDEGEIWVRGPMVMKGYNNLPELTAEVLTVAGYFKTGDIGKVDADGFVFITGRKKDLIIVAGEKAAPREIEEILMAHPAVAEAAVVGKKDASRGEVVVAYVILREGQIATDDQMRDFCRRKGLAQWKIPREITIVADFPRSPTGKVLKRVLSQQMQV